MGSSIVQFLFIVLWAHCLVNAHRHVDPCQDFYAFACEGFINKAHLPKGKLFVDQLTLLDDDVKNKMTRLLEDDHSEDVHSTKLAKTFYNTCLLNDSNVEELQTLLEELHNWPVESSYNWVNALYKLRELGLPVDSVFQILIEPGHELVISQPPIRWYISNDTEENPQTAAYFKYMTDTAMQLGSDREKAEADMMDVLLLENEIEKIKHYNFYYGRWEAISTISDLSSMEPRFPWLEYINNMMLGDKEMDENQKITTYDPDYINMIMDLFLHTENRTLVNFINWKVVDFAMDYLSKNLKQIKSIFLAHIRLKEVYESKNEECLHNTLKKFPDVATALYLKTYLTKAEQLVIEEMVKEIRKEFREMINETQWMDEETKEEASRKLADLRVQVGFPEGLLEEDKLESKYEELELTSSSFLQTMMNVSKFLQNVYFSNLNQPYNVEEAGDELFDHVVSTKAAFHTSLHRIDLPAGLLQPPIFNISSSKEVNYGSIGYVIGHEFNHGFNQRASSFNSAGDYDPWWTEATKEAFQNKSQCVIDAYEDIIRDYLDEQVIGSRSLEENLADLAGAKIAYRAYQKTIELNQEELSTSGTHSPNQQFWLSLANFHCAKYDIPQLKRSRSLRYDTHLPRKARMNGIAMNNEDFARDWNCEPGSPMNPQQKCLVW